MLPVFSTMSLIDFLQHFDVAIRLLQRRLPPLDFLLATGFLLPQFLKTLAERPLIPLLLDQSHDIQRAARVDRRGVVLCLWQFCDKFRLTVFQRLLGAERLGQLCSLLVTLHRSQFEHGLKPKLVLGHIFFAYTSEPSSAAA